MPVDFGRYTLHEKIGAGGMAEVYRATTAGAGGFEKQFAIKRILDHQAEDSEFINMFMDEARIVAALSHPNIAQVFEFDQLDGVYYLAMEYVQGRNLSQVLRAARERNRPFEHDLAIHVAMETCKGLYAAHGARDSRGKRMKIIHRDISPQNVQISFAGDVKILDFGVAKARDKIIKTEAGTIRGKLMYMAPEQVRAKKLDHRADLFSLGLVLYKSLTGVHPFDADSEVKVVEKIRKAQILPPSEIVVGLPLGLDDVVMRALAISPDDRYPDAAEFHRDLTKILHGTSPGFTFSSLSSYMQGLFTHELQASGFAHTQVTKLGQSGADSALSESALRVDTDDLIEFDGGAPRPNAADADTTGDVARGRELPARTPSGLVDGVPTIEVAGPPAPPGFSTGANQLRAPPPPTQQLGPADLPDDSSPSGTGPIGLEREKRLSGLGRGKLIFGSSVALGTLFGIVAAVALTPSGKGIEGRAAAGFGALSVATAPSGAEIHLDGRQLKNELGRPLVTPAEVERLVPGAHTLRLSIPGYDPWEGEIKVRAATRMPVKKHLVLTPGRLKLTSSPTGAKVWLDGEERGSTPMIIDDIDRGREHTLRLEAGGREPHEQKLSMEEEELDLRLELAPVARPPAPSSPTPTPTPSPARPTPRPAPAAVRPARTFRAVDAPEPKAAERYGWLSLNSIPSARVHVDGEDTRKSTPASRLRLTAGRHTVKLVNSKLALSREFDVVIRGGETHTRRVDFREAP